MAKLSDSELLAIVSDEAKRSIGFEYDNELMADRERALQYRKGEMNDLPAMPNRSKAVSTDVADVIETILPDLIEIFTTGDDVVTFDPTGPEDEEGAQQETDYLNHVFFNENNGWLILYSFFKDACEVKTGVVKWAWEEYDQADESFEGKSQEEAAVILQNVQARQGELKELTENEDGSVNLTVAYPPKGKACVYPVPPEDFTVARDTQLSLSDATYCAMRSRRRAQDLIAEGIDRETVERLPAYTTRNSDTIELARDTAGEDDFTQVGGMGDLREVEIVEHYIRVDADGDGKPELIRVVTGGNESILVEREEVERIPFAAITPYIVTHRFYGESVADKILEIQKIKTATLRMFLDSGYFALNQRVEVGMDQANQWTISDLLRNEPGVPVRVKTVGAVKPISAGGLSFDPLAALEYLSTMSEQRTGIVRNAQGLNPDTLHDTAKGAQALMNAAQKRVKLIARIFAETGVKALFLGLHSLIRKHATSAAKVRLRNQWVDVDPTNWGERNDMTIEVGNGSSGREIDLMEIGNILAAQKELIALQGGVNGPFVTAENLHYSLTRYVEKTGQKNPDMFFSDPKTQPPQPPKPDPKMVEAQQKMQLEQQAQAGRLQLEQQKAQVQAQTDQAKAATDLQLKQAEMEATLQIKREQIAAELQLKREQLEAELMLKREQMQAETAIRASQAARDADRADYETSANVSDVQPGGEAG